MKSKRNAAALVAMFACLVFGCDDQITDSPSNDAATTVDSGGDRSPDQSDTVGSDTVRVEVWDGVGADGEVSVHEVQEDIAADEPDTTELNGACVSVPFRALVPDWPRISTFWAGEDLHIISTPSELESLVGDTGSAQVDWAQEWIVHVAVRRPLGGTIQLDSVERCPGLVPEVALGLVLREPDDSTCLVQPMSGNASLHGFFAMPIQVGLAPNSVALVSASTEMFGCSTESPGNGAPCVAGELCRPESYCAGLTAFDRGVCVPQAWYYQSTNLNSIAVPDSPAPGPQSSNMIVAPLGHVVRDIYVQWTVEHPMRSDLRVTLIGPAGREVVLAEPGSTYYIADATPFEFFGDDATGIWTLGVSDVVNSNAGNLSSWSIAIITEAL